jgi:endonuclease G
MPSREEQVAAYLRRVAAKGPVKDLIQTTLYGGPESTESPASAQKRAAAQAGLEEIARDRVPAPEQSAGLEAIILPKIRPVLNVVDGKFHTDHPLWLMLNDDNGTPRQVLLKVIPAVGRIELPGNPSYPYGGTGFVVGKGLIMTNRHVAAIFTSGLGTRRLTFKPGFRAGIDFLRELDRPTGPTLDVRCVVMVHPYWDMALLEVDGLTAAVEPLKLSQRDVSTQEMIQVAAIGYPAFDTRNDATVQNDLFGHVFGVKRLQPGTMGGIVKTESFGKAVEAVKHNCSTLGGNSGSALIDLESGTVVALHFGGRYRVINYGVPANALAEDGRVVDAGVHFEGKARGGEPPWSEWWRRADEGPVGDIATGRSVVPRAEQRSAGDGSTPQVHSDGTLHIVVPLHVSLRFGNVEQGIDLKVRAPDEAMDELERMVMPWHDEDYSSRTGYDPKFIGVKIPMPKPADPSVVASTKDGGDVLHYQNFSIVTHAKRRMALFTASNVTAEPDLRKPEARRAYTRKGLSGLGAGDQERWFLDPRLNEDYQLPDVFYSRSGFDRSHIVRRDDVAWGSSYELVRRANGDSFHLTNCSPQVPDFNRSSLGEDNWGDLENHVLKSAASERYCQFAGPLFDDKDEVYLGKGDGRTRLRAKIPSRYWKVIVVRAEDGIASYGFVLEQDLSQVSFEEFTVPEKFGQFMEPLDELQKRAGIVFPENVLAVDQYSTNEGMDLAFRAGLKRRAGKG